MTVALMFSNLAVVLAFVVFGLADGWRERLGAVGMILVACCLVVFTAYQVARGIP